MTATICSVIRRGERTTCAGFSTGWQGLKRSGRSWIASRRATQSPAISPFSTVAWLPRARRVCRSRLTSPSRMARSRKSRDPQKALHGTTTGHGPVLCKRGNASLAPRNQPRPWREPRREARCRSGSAGTINPPRRPNLLPPKPQRAPGWMRSSTATSTRRWRSSRTIRSSGSGRIRPWGWKKFAPCSSGWPARKRASV